MLNDHLLQAKIVLPPEAPISEICNYCNWTNSELFVFNFKINLFLKKIYIN